MLTNVSVKIFIEKSYKAVKALGFVLPFHDDDQIFKTGIRPNSISLLQSICIGSESTIL
jgi:hypothetical protein